MLRASFTNTKRLVAVSTLHVERLELEFLEEVPILTDFFEFLFLQDQQMPALACNAAVPLKFMV
jgi:hypothetical protein